MTRTLTRKTIGRAAAASVLLGALGMLGVLGCGAGDAVRIGGNLARKDSHLKIRLDGQDAKQNTLKKGATGYAEFKVNKPVGTSPVLRFDIEDPDRFGRITMVSAQIHQKFKADYSHQAEFVITSASQDPQAQMKPGVDYNLGSPGAAFRVLDLTGNTVSGVSLQPGMKYMLVLTVKADKSESAQVYFETR